MGWMGRVHSAAYRRVLEHFPDLGVTPAAAWSPPTSSEHRRAHAERVGFERTTDDWRAVIDDPAVEVVNITLPNAMHREVAIAALAGRQARVGREARRARRSRTPPPSPRRPAPRRRRHRRRLLLPLRARRPARPRPDRGGAIGEVNHYRAVFLADYANRPDAAASWRFLRAAGRLGRARRPDGPRRRPDPQPGRPDRPGSAAAPRRSSPGARARPARARTSAASRPTTSSTSRTRTGRPR